MKRLLLLPFLLWLTNGCTEKPTQTFTRSVMLTTPTPSGAESIKNFSGVVQESHNIGLGFKTAGQIEKIYVKEGDYVKKRPVNRPTGPHRLPTGCTGSGNTMQATGR